MKIKVVSIKDRKERQVDSVEFSIVGSMDITNVEDSFETIREAVDKLSEMGSVDAIDVKLLIK